MQDYNHHIRLQIVCMEADSEAPEQVVSNLSLNSLGGQPGSQRKTTTRKLLVLMNAVLPNCSKIRFFRQGNPEVILMASHMKEIGSIIKLENDGCEILRG